MTSVALFLEAESPGVRIALHLIDDDGVTLRSAAGPSLRPEFVSDMDEIVIGPHAATAGAAAYRHEMVVSENISTDPLWHDYRALAREQGFQASWALPVRSPHGRLVGVLSAFLTESRGPSVHELRVAELATQLGGMAIDRHQAAQALRQSEASFRSFVENSPIGIYRATGTGRLLAVNPSLVRLLGYASAGELLQIDMTRDVFVRAEDVDRLQKELTMHGDALSSEMEWRRKDGRIVAVRVSARAYRDERGYVWLLEGFVENVTPLRAAERALRQSEKLAALGQLVSGVAHELNNPLSAILNFAEDLLEDQRSEDDREALAIIRDQARRARAIVRDLLSFVRVRESGRERLRLGELISSTVQGVRSAVAETGATLKVEPLEPDVVGWTDRRGLEQVLTNVVANAAQAARAGGLVVVHPTATAENLQIVVEDNGPGIPVGLIDRIFEPFFTTKPVGEGTGLGLSVTLGIVQQLGGRIVAENRPAADGTGARFTITIPIDGASDVERPRNPREISMTPEKPVAKATEPRVLIIDDEASIRAALRRFFTRRHWQVDEAEDGAAGLSRLKAAPRAFDLIISDLKMPGCSGFDIHDHLAASDPDVLPRLILSTGDMATEEVAAFMQRTKCTVLQKPFELRTLDTVIASIRQSAVATG